MYLLSIILFFTLSNSLIISNKFCINCKYIIHNINNDYFYAKCSFYPKEKDNYLYLITGNKSDIKCDYCSIAREFDSMCGIDGKNYEEKI